MRKPRYQPKDWIEEVALRIVERRLELGWTQEELGERIGCGNSHVNHWERARRCPSSWNLRRLCEAMNVSSDWLLGLKS